MNNFKSILLSAVAVSSVGTSTAFAQAVVAPALVGTELKGAGASSIESVLVQAFNCVSGPTNAQQLGKGAPTPTGALATVTSGVFTPTTPNAANPVFTCATDSIQPNFKAKYVSTGSGFGREIWRNFSNRFLSGTPGATQSNPFEIINGDPAWTNVQFAFSDGPIASSDVTAYNTNANSATNQAGNGIQVPLYVLPVALAYNPQYGVTAGNVALNFTGPIKLQTAQYCNIMNGVTTNWKSIPAVVALAASGDGGRFSSEGVPIHLVGRSDNSGTTDIFTRHLSQANVCGTNPLTNKFTGASQQLPTSLKSTTVTYIGGVYYASGVATPNTGEPLTPGAGVYGLATGSSEVYNAVNSAPYETLASGVTVNGRFGYVSGDFVAPVAGRTIFAAQLTQVGSSTVYKKPIAADAAAAFATILPPQSTSSGAYSTTDPRKNSATGVLVSRANPLDWADVLYSRADIFGGFTAKTLAAPSVGYPITGTTFLLTSTCFKKDSDRYAISEFVYANLKKISKTSVPAPGPGDKVSTSTFSGTAANLLGLTAQAGTSPLSAAWQKAIFETFMQKTTGALGARGLWIQSKQPTTTLTGITSNTGGTDSNVGGVPAAACAANAGA